MIPNLAKPDIKWDLPKKIFTIDNVLSDDECSRLIEFGKKHVQPGVDKYPRMFTTSFHACLLELNDPVHDKLQDAYRQIVDFFEFDISFVEPMELKRYTTDDYFGQHVDNYYSINQNLDRKITVVLQLTDDTEYNGGDLNIFGQMGNKKKGSLTAFPSFFPHKVDIMTHGERWSLILWMWGPYWK